MKRVSTILFSICLALTLLASTNATAWCSTHHYGGSVYYPDFRPGYYGDNYYGGGLIYYPNSEFFYHIPRSGVAYNNDVNCQLIPGCGVKRIPCPTCVRPVKRYRVVKCQMVPGYRDKHGCWIKKHKICWYTTH